MRRTSGSTTWWSRVWRRQAWPQTQNSQVAASDLCSHSHPWFCTKHWKAVGLAVVGKVHVRISWGESQSHADREQFGNNKPLPDHPCHAFQTQTGYVQRKGLRVQKSFLFGRAFTECFKLCHAFLFDLQIWVKLIAQSIKRGQVYCLGITTAVTDKAYIQVISLSRPHTILQTYDYWSLLKLFVKSFLWLFKPLFSRGLEM